MKRRDFLTVKNYTATYVPTPKQLENVALQRRIGFGYTIYTSPYWFGLAVNRFQRIFDEKAK